MKLFILFTLFSVNLCAISESLFDKYFLEEKNAISPIRVELPSRFDDQDICEIFHGKDLQDCEVNIEGPTPPPSPTPSK